MRLATVLASCALLLAACGKVEQNQDGSPNDHRDDGGGGGDSGSSVSDAGGPDATPVACNGPEDCANPDDPCLLPGTCDDDVCHFPEKDCSELDGECTRGVCADDGECEARAIRQDMACGDGIMDCGAYGVCDGFADTCDESGTETRTCRDSTCQSGECVRGAPYDDSRGCSRSTTGVICADQELNCQNCVYTSTCDNDDPIDCTLTDYSCSGQVCTPSQSSFTDNNSCDRDTEGNPCGSDGCCTPTGLCSPSCV